MNLAFLARRHRIATQLNLVAILTALALCGLSVSSLNSAQSISAAANHLRSEALAAVVVSAELGVLVESHRRIIEAAPVSFDKVRVDRDRRSSEAIADRINTIISTRHNRLLDPVKRQLPQFFELGRRVLYLAANYAQDEALKSATNYAKIAARLQERIVTYREYNLRNADVDATSLINTIEHLVQLIFAASLFAAALVGPLTIAVVRHVADRLRAITQAMRALAQNDIETPIPSLQSTDEIGDMARAVSVFKDNAIALRAQHQEIASLNARFDIALNNMVRGLSMFDENGYLIVCNTIYRDMYDLPVELTVPGTSFKNIINYWQSINSLCPNEDASEKIDSWIAYHGERIATGIEHCELHNLPNDRVYSINTRPLPGSGWVDVHEDITEEHRSVTRISEQAQTDALTGLANRHSFRDELEKCFAAEAGQFAIIWIDLDHFKEVNDTFGHPTGDELLKIVAEKLKNSLRGRDFLARLGGDEFACIVRGDNITHEILTRITSRLNAVISKSTLALGNWVKVGASIGISTAPQDGDSPDEIMKTADIALYRAKAEGRGKAIFFNAAMAEEISKRRRLQSDLEDAINQQKLELYYQPILSVKERRVKSFEALMRWRHPELGFISPAEFIPLAEETGLISDVGAWALRSACSTAAQWPDDIAVSVNLSAAQFRGTGVGDKDGIEFIVRDALQRASLPPQRLQLEVTETLLLDDKSETWATLAKLKELGISIALDDFGTGYSSLGYLRRFPFDKIKIDQSFVRDLGERPDSITIVKAISDLSNTLGMVCVAEGVETLEQLQFIEAAHCGEMQGYLFSRPVPVDQIPATLSKCQNLREAA